jgi:hypothetical protein
VYGFLDKLLTENDLAFLKWDYNRNWSEPGWDQLPPNEQKKVYVDFTRNLYSILAELHSKHPKVDWNPAPAAAAALISASFNTPTRSGPQTTPIPSTASRSRTASATPTRRRS